MSTKAGTMGFSDRPALFTFWTVTVSVLAAAALILSAVALNVAGRGDRSVTSVEGTGIGEAASIGSPLWDAGKLEAMQGRVLAETVRVQGSAPLWDAGKLDAMQGRVLAETLLGPRDRRPAVGRRQAAGHGGPCARRLARSARSAVPQILTVIREAGGPHPGPPASPASSLGARLGDSRRDPVFRGGLAETPGFEPGKECYPLNRLAGGSFRPLRHVSAKDSRR